MAIREIHSSIRKLRGWCLALTLVALPAAAGDLVGGAQARFLPLELLDREVVLANRVRSMTVAVLFGESDQSDEPAHCYVGSFEFDENGNVILHSPPLVGSDYYYSYDEHNDLVGFGRIDSDGETYSLSEYIEETKSRVEFYEATPAVDNAQIIRSVASACLNMDADYRFSTEFGENGLPRIARARKTSESQSGAFPVDAPPRSPDRLHIEFSYAIRDTP